MTEETELKAFAERLNAVCDAMDVPPKGRSRQLVVAKEFLVSQNAARKWLEGEGYPATSMGKRIAAWGKVSFDWLMTGERPLPAEINIGNAFAQNAPFQPPAQPQAAQSPLIVAATRLDRSPLISEESKAALTLYLQTLLKNKNTP